MDAAEVRLRRYYARHQLDLQVRHRGRSAYDQRQRIYRRVRWPTSSSPPPPGPINFGPLTPSAHSATSLTVPVPISTVTTLGQGVVSVVVVNTDQSFTHSNAITAQLLGDTRAGFSNLLKINGVGLAATSTDPSYATDNVETVVMQNHTVTLGGSGLRYRPRRRDRPVLRLSGGQDTYDISQSGSPWPYPDRS